MVHVMLILCSPRQVFVLASKMQLRMNPNSANRLTAHAQANLSRNTLQERYAPSLNRTTYTPLETPNLEPGVPRMASCIRFRVQLRMVTYVWADISPCIEGGDVFSSFFVVARDRALSAAQLPGTQEKQKRVSNSRHRIM
jgi:hypothetical protein